MSNSINSTTAIYDYLALKTIKGATDTIIYNLYQNRGSIEGIFTLTAEELHSYDIPSNKIIDSIINKRYDKEFVDKELSLLDKYNIHLITLDDPNYPQLLKEISSPPPYLYCNGDISLLNSNIISVVGARKCSKYSEEFTRRLSADLAASGFTVISGFALGIDIAAHLGAITKGKTMVVLGSGLLDIYPKQNYKYIDTILENGLFITEFSFSEPPIAQNFPRRNRIISGLSLGVVVIEASARSGSLITCRYALEQDREVFAVPNFPSSINSATNKLIKDGAKLVENYLDIIEEFKYLFNNSDNHNIITTNDKDMLLPIFNNPLKHNVYKTMMIAPIDLNELCIKLSIPIIELLSIVMELELEGYICKDEDNRYFYENNRK